MTRFVVPLACAFALSCAAPAWADTVGTITGTVVHDGHPVPATIVHLSGERFAQTVTTDTHGRFAFARVPFGHYTLAADVGGTSATADVDVASGVVSVVRLAPDTRKTIGAVSGGTRGVRGTPVSENALLPNAIATLPRGDSLNGLVESVPGIVRFSYDEPVAHGYHGLTYELDGAPLPQSTSSNFSELIDPRNVQAVDVFTGAFPAEYGGSRMGAVVNVVSRAPDPSGPPVGAFTIGAGSYGTAEGRFNESFHVGATAVSFSANETRSNRGLDAPTPDSELTHDAANLSDQFLRVVAPAGRGNVLAFDLSNQFAGYQIPINTNPDDPNNAFVSAPGTDDVQREYDRFASVSFTHTSNDGLGAVQVVPWVRSSRIAYDGDLPLDVLATLPDPDTGDPDLQNGLRQDQRANYVGLRTSIARSSEIHAFKAGLDLSRETYSNAGFIELADAAGEQRTDVVASGALVGAYIQDRWALGSHFAVNYGLRFDHSTGFVGGSQLSPRLEVNYSFDRATVFHAYAGRLYAAPALEDTRQDAIITQTTAEANPPYDLKPERDSYVEFGLAHTFHPGLSMYANAWQRNVVNVLDTTQLLNTPLFAVFNNAIGHANGLELRVQGNSPRDTFYLSTTLSESLAGGISGSTFLFPPDQISDLTLNPEDHDQAVAINAAYTHRFGADRAIYATLEPEYGTGYPVTFQNGDDGRLPNHLIVNASVGRIASAKANRLGMALVAENLFNHQYLIKVNNGFNTTQWAAGRRIVLRLTAAL